MKCELLPELLGDLSHMWMLWSWSLRRNIHLDFPLLPPTCLHMAFGNSLLLRLPIPSEMELPSQTLASSGPRLTFSCWSQDGSYTQVYPWIKYCWESSYYGHSIPVLALPTEPLSGPHGPCSHSPGPDNMQIFFTVLAHVSINARVHHRLLSPQSASLATTNEPPHIMWWQERKGFWSKILEDMKRTSYNTEVFLLKLKGTASLLTERKTSACATSKGVTSESYLFQRRNSIIQDLCTVVHFKWKFKPTTAQHAWILLDWKTAGNKCTHLAT